MEFNTKLSKLIVRRKVIETRKRTIIDEYSISIETFYNGLNILYNWLLYY